MTLNWGQPFKARRWHIFDGMTSLCGNWAYGADQEVADDDTYSEGGDCKKCCEKAGLIDNE